MSDQAFQQFKTFLEQKEKNDSQQKEQGVLKEIDEVKAADGVIEDNVSEFVSEEIIDCSHERIDEEYQESSLEEFDNTCK